MTEGNKSPKGTGGPIVRNTVTFTIAGAALGAVLMAWFLFLQSDGIPLWSDDWLSSTGNADTPIGEAWFNAARTSLTALGALGIGGAAYLAFRRQSSKEVEREDALKRDALSAERDQEAKRKAAIEETRNAELDRHAIERGLHDRTTTAAEQLGHGNPSIRMAGVHALTAIADDWLELDQKDQAQAVVSVMTSYVRADSYPIAPPDNATDAEHRAHLNAIAREDGVRRSILRSISDRKSGGDDDRWEALSIDLSGGRFRHEFTGARMAKVELVRSDLSGADLQLVHLVRCQLSNCNLTKAHLFLANLTGSRLGNANLTGANLVRANLSSATLWSADLSGAQLRWADLSGATLTGANLSGADLSGANLSGADLRGVRGARRSQFTTEQLESMKVQPPFARDDDSESNDRAPYTIWFPESPTHED